MAKSFVAGRQYSLANFENKTNIVGDAVFNGSIVYLPIGTNGISILDFDNFGTYREVGRWGRQTPTFPDTEESPFRDTMFISDLLIDNGYLYAFDLNLPLVFILRIFNEELHFVNYVRKPSDYKDRPEARERKTELLRPYFIDNDSLHLAHLVDIQKTFLDQNNEGLWLDQVSFSKIGFSQPPVSFDEFNKINGEDWSLVNSLAVTTLPDTNELSVVGDGDILKREEKFFPSALPNNLPVAVDATDMYAAYSFTLDEPDTDAADKVFEAADNRMIIFKFPIGADPSGVKVADLDAMTVHAAALADSTGTQYQVARDSGNNNSPSIYTSVANVPAGETTYVGNEASFNLLHNFEVSKSISLGVGADSGGARVFDMVEFGDYLYIAAGTEDLKVVAKSDLTAVDQTITFLNDSSEQEDVIGLARSDEDIFVLTIDGTNVYARAMTQEVGGGLTQNGKATFDTSYDKIHADSDGTFLVTGANNINGYFYGDNNLGNLGQTTNDPLLTPYKRPGWFTIPILKNFRFLPNCDVVARGIGDGNYDVSYTGTLPPDPAVTHNFVPEAVTITPLKVQAYSAANFKKVFETMFKNARGRLFGLAVSESGSNLEIAIGSIVYDGQIIENDSIYTLDVTGAVADSYVRYDEPLNDFVFEAAGPAAATDAVIATYDGVVWTLAPQIALTPRVVTDTTYGIEMEENGDLNF